MKKNVLFVSISSYEFMHRNSHLAKKFEGLSASLNVFLIGRGKGFFQNVWNCKFYLIGSRILYVPIAIITGSYLCIFKKVDVIVCQGPLTEGLIGVMLKTIFGKELIVEIHGDWKEGPFINRKRLFSPLLRRIVPVMANWSFSKADKIRGVAEYFLADLKKKYPSKKFFVFQTFSDLDLFLMGNSYGKQSGLVGQDVIANLSSDETYICTVAVISPIKSIETLIEAFARISSKFPKLKLVIVGDGPSLENCKLQITNYKLDERVVLTGRLPQEKVKDIMKDCYAFALPSLSEGLPRVLLEAMALAKPVVASRVGGIPEIVEDNENGLLFESRDADALSQKLEYLTANPDIASQMGARGQQFVRENFSNERYIRNYVEMVKA